MKITEKKVTVREVTDGYFNDAEEGVTAFDETWIFVQSINVNSYMMTKNEMRLSVQL